MNSKLRLLLLAAALGACSLCAQASDAPAGAVATPPQMIALKVSVDAAGKVVAVKPTGSQTAPGLDRAAEEFARKLVFTPARKGGKAVSSETHLTLAIALEPVGEGRFAPKLKRAFSGPGLLHLGKMEAPKYQGPQGGALVVVAVDVGADGAPVPASQTTERMELREPNKFAEARYLDAVTISVRGSRFELDKVDGAVVPSRLSLPYQFGGGPAKRPEGEKKRGAKPPVMDVTSMPIMTAVSAVPGIDLAKVDYKAPDPVAPAK
jgi:TonB family protein